MKQQSLLDEAGDEILIKMPTTLQDQWYVQNKVKCYGKAFKPPLNDTNG